MMPTPVVDRNETSAAAAGEAYTEEELASQKYFEEGRTFYCSELVIKIYKICGILEPTEESCKNFWPSHLSSNSNKIKL